MPPLGVRFYNRPLRLMVIFALQKISSATAFLMSEFLCVYVLLIRMNLLDQLDK
jgi:hypothetical protein